MERKKFAIAWIVCLLFLASCTYNIGLVKTTYQMLSASQISYDTALKMAADLYHQERITDREKESIIAVGTIYATAHNAAVEALASYQETRSMEDQEAMTKQIEIATNALAKLLHLLQPYLEAK